MDAKERLAELMLLQGALSSVWPTLEKEFLKRKDLYLSRLVSFNDEGTRGRIKELNELLELPERLQREAQALVAPQQEGELP